VATYKEIEEQYTLRLFSENLRLVYERLRELKTKLSSLNASFFTIDLRKNVKDGDQNHPIKENSIDLIVTSPPYPNATDYHLYQRFRLFWLGFDPRILAKAEIGSHLRHQKENTGFDDYLHEMSLCMKNMFIALKHDRYSAIVVGDAIFNKHLYKTVDGLSKIATEIGFENIMSIDREVHKTRRSFIKAGRRATSENILILRKP
jgi:DNA modification methylase